MSVQREASVQDQYSWLDYKEQFRNASSMRGSATRMKRSWVPEDEQRRLMAYRLLDAYYKNRSAEWMSREADEDQKKNRREYGDAFVLVETALASLIGDDQTVQVRHLEMPPEPRVDDEGNVVLDEMTQDPIIETPEDEAAIGLNSVLEDWMVKERFIQKMIECERNAVKLGDGVYVLGFDERRGRPRISVWDPGMYFPDVEMQHLSDEDYPSTVCIAYEFVGREQPRETFVRRIMWWLADVEEWTTAWSSSSDQVCWMSDGIWKLDDVNTDVFSFRDQDAVEWLIEPMMLPIDFIPVVHIPNRVAGQEIYGTSVLGSILPILDEMQACDTDIAATAALVGSPPLAISGGSLPKNDKGQIDTYGPGMVFETGEGTATVLDTSTCLDALMKLSDALSTRLSVNSRTPESLMGRVKPSEVPSGIALTLSFTPHGSLIREMRLVREEKYAILFRFVMRMMAVKDPQITAFGEREANLKFGSFLPADMQETSAMVVNLLSTQAISLETAIGMLIASGFQIDNVQEEIARIRSVDFTNALSAIDATADPNAGREYLGLDPLPLEDVEDEETDPTTKEQL
ncbi:MAG: hypothetical protein E6R03_12790 [Hyphomicrobiaceae bacterium]|nr:MAG: hypothetical protein E6R03_12790 [Hyphomicrobiaceae bacterium]